LIQKHANRRSDRNRYKEKGIKELGNWQETQCREEKGGCGREVAKRKKRITSWRKNKGSRTQTKDDLKLKKNARKKQRTEVQTTDRGKKVEGKEKEKTTTTEGKKDVDKSRRKTRGSVSGLPKSCGWEKKRGEGGGKDARGNSSPLIKG